MAVKLTVLLLLASLVPLLVASLLNTRRAIDSVEQTATQNLHLLAQVTATRIDQLVISTQREQDRSSRTDAQHDDVTMVVVRFV